MQLNGRHETTGVANPWQYAAGSFESSTGFVKFGVRYYDPSLGRWTQQDPVAGSLGNPDSLNRYVYVGDNPVNVIDPTGRLNVGNQLVQACIVGAVGAVVAFILGAIGASALSIAFLPITVAALILGAVVGCLAGVVSTAVMIVLDQLLPS